MHRLGGNDAYHLFEESSVQNMHTVKTVIVDPGTRSRIDLAAVRTWADAHLARIPPLRWRLVEAPLGAGLPFFRDGGSFDVDRHVTGTTLAVPGDERALDGLVSELAGGSIDRDHPLWQLRVVDGLADGRVALVFRIHHALADGQAAVRILEEAFGVREPPDAEVPPGEMQPSAAQVLRQALPEQWQRWRRIPEHLRALGAMNRRVAERGHTGSPPVRMFAAPPTRFNARLGTDRIAVNVTLPLAELVAVKESFGVTVNDVYLAICGGALRRYLAERGELPEESITATSPVAVRTEGDPPYGNAVAVWHVTLGSDVADPSARVAAVHEAASTARELAGDSADLLPQVQDTYVLYRALLRATTLAERVKRRPMFNATVSNVRGPRPLTFLGAPVVAVRSLGPLVGRQGLNLTAWSYGEDFAVGLHACRQHVPDLARLGELLRVELEAMVDAAGVSRPRRRRS